MQTPAILQRTLQSLFITGISIFALAPAYAADPVKVTADNYVRAESDFQMRGYIKGFNCFGKFHHSRKPYDVENQVTVRGNRDTLYSFGVFDLRSPVTITLPETRGRYQSLMIVNQDHSIWGLYGPKKGTLTEENVGTLYVFLLIRTFAMLYYLSHNIVVPEKHKEEGLVTTTMTKEGNEFNWDQTPAGAMLKVKSTKWSRPDNAFISVPYRGAWFYIADNDLNSKSTFMLLKQLFSLQAGHIRDAGPTLTLPVGGG